MNEATFGLLLAGGRARRMGGGDKPLRAIAGKAILAWVIERLAPQCGGLLLSANGDPERFAEYRLSVVADDVRGFAGPLAGILAGLDWLAAEHSSVSWGVSVAADTPFIPDDLVAALHAGRREGNADIAVAASAGRQHPVVALWPVEIRHALRNAVVGENVRKIDRFTSGFKVATVGWSADPFDPFLNINSPQDIALAEPIGARLAGIAFNQ
jgi:molybdenum cofactor guanylyltransferase